MGSKRKWIRVDDPNTKKHADKLLARLLTDVHAGEFRELKRITFADFAEKWFEDYVDDPNHLKASTSFHYHDRFRKHLLPYFADYELVNITPDLVQGFVAELSRGGLMPATIRACLAPMTKMLNHAVRWGYLRMSPMPLVESPKIRGSEQQFLTGEELSTVLERIPVKWRAFFTAVALTGMRLGEALAMRWSNLDWEAGQYHVRERLYRGSMDVPKSPSSLRTVDLSPRLLTTLRAHRKQQTEVKLMLKEYEDTDLVFCRHNGKQINGQQMLRDALKQAAKTIGRPDLKVHDLRHTYASLLIEQNAKPKYIQRQLRHASISTTLDIYGHLMEDAGEEVVRRLDEQVFGGALEGG